MQPGPAPGQSGRRGPLDRGWGQGCRSSKQAPAAAPRWTGSTFPDTPGRFLRGPPPESGLFLKIEPPERGLEREWQIPPTKLTGRFQAKQNSLLPVFSEERWSATLPQTRLLRTKSPSKGVSELPFAESPPRLAFSFPATFAGKEENISLVFKRSGGWGVVRGVVPRPDRAVSARSAPACRTG